MASQDRQRRRNPAWNTNLTAPTAHSFRATSLPFPTGVPKVATLRNPVVVAPPTSRGGGRVPGRLSGSDAGTAGHGRSRLSSG